MYKMCCNILKEYKYINKMFYNVNMNVKLKIKQETSNKNIGMLFLIDTE